MFCGKNTYSTNMLREDILHSLSYIQIYFITIEYLQFSSQCNSGKPFNVPMRIYCRIFVSATGTAPSFETYLFLDIMIKIFRRLSDEMFHGRQESRYSNRRSKCDDVSFRVRMSAIARKSKT